MYLVINKCVTAVKVSNFSGHCLRNRSTLDIGILGYIGIVQHMEHSAEVLSIPPGTLCIYSYRIKELCIKLVIWNNSIPWCTVRKTSNYQCVCILALYILYAKNMRRMSSVTCLDLPHLFFTLPHKRQDFRKKIKLFSTKCVFRFSLQLFSELLLTVRRIRRDIIINVRRSSCKVHPFFLTDFNVTSTFSADFLRILRYQI